MKIEKIKRIFKLLEEKLHPFKIGDNKFHYPNLLFHSDEVSSSINVNMFSENHTEFNFYPHNQIGRYCLVFDGEVCLPSERELELIINDVESDLVLSKESQIKNLKSKVLKIEEQIKRLKQK